MQVRGPKNVERAVQMDPISTLLRYASAITEQKKMSGVVGSKSLTAFERCTTTPNNTRQHATWCANGRNM